MLQIVDERVLRVKHPFERSIVGVPPPLGTKGLRKQDVYHAQSQDISLHNLCSFLASLAARRMLIAETRTEYVRLQRYFE